MTATTLHVPPPRRARTVVVVLVLVALAAGAGWWAARATLPPSDPVASDTAAQQTYAVQEVTVGQSLNLSVVAARVQEPVARAVRPGTVTEADPALRTAAPGAVLYRVDEQPVLAAAGAVPFYRDLTPGLRGRDVTQLNQLLADAGWLGAGTGVGDTFTAATTVGVRAMERATGATVDGVVARGDLLALPSLPLDVVLAPGVTTGVVLAGGEDAVLAVAGEPTLTMELADAQLDLVPPGARVVVTAAGAEFASVLGDPVIGADGTARAPLRPGPDGAPPCPDACAAAVDVRTGGTDDGAVGITGGVGGTGGAGGTGGVGGTVLPARVVVTPDTTGPGVPVAALDVGPDGSTSITTAGGDVVPVTVLASSGGLAVVAGVEVGDEIVVGG